MRGARVAVRRSIFYGATEIGRPREAPVQALCLNREDVPS